MAQRPKHARPGRVLGFLAVLIVALAGTLIAGVQATGDQENGASYAPRLALDLEGGTQLILTPKATDDSQVTQADVDQAIDIIRKRVDASGVAEAEITSQGGSNIVVALPGNPSDETLNLVRQSALLRFRPVLTLGGPGTIDPAALEQPTDAPTDGATPAPTAAATPPTQQEIDAAAMAVSDQDGDGVLSDQPATEPANSSDLAWITEQVSYDYYTFDCTDPANLAGGVVDDPAAPLVACTPDGSAKFILGPTALEGTHVDSASSGVGTNSQGVSTGEWIVNLEMDGEGTDVFAEFSQRLLTLPAPQNQFAVVLDGLVISNATMNDYIPNGKAQISGSFTQETAAALANQLNFGSLPLNFEVQSQDEISATLGSEQLARGVLAGIVGAALVVLYMIWQYRGLGLVSVASLMVAAALNYLVIALLSWGIGYRLSLPGVVGLIIAVGITADSFIVYFERIRDEVREGRILVAAVEHGWARARRTILASDAVNFLAAGVLYFLAVGGVQGFAFTLGLTTVIDLVVVILFTHPLMRLLVRTEFFGQGHRLSGLAAASLGATSATYRGRGTFRPRAGAQEPVDEEDENALVPVGAGARAGSRPDGGAQASTSRAGVGAAGGAPPADEGTGDASSRSPAAEDTARRRAPSVLAVDENGRRLTIAERRAAERAAQRAAQAQAEPAPDRPDPEKPDPDRPGSDEADGDQPAPAETDTDQPAGNDDHDATGGER
ncbi:MAG: protein translocase subunit SecD [Georgenia sp.]